MLKPGMKKVRDNIIGCKLCSLAKTRILPVIGEGDHSAKIMFVGEAPGATEDKTGHPFCGRSGNILSELVESIGAKREDVYICNILKCRPPNNRNPQKSEINTCTPYLYEQIKIIKPKVICCLGNFSVHFIMEKFGLKDIIKGISQIHGQVFNGENDEVGKVKIAPMYHPAVATYNANMKTTLMEDFKILKDM
jgi:DNA polymerase